MVGKHIKKTFTEKTALFVQFLELKLHHRETELEIFKGKVGMTENERFNYDLAKYHYECVMKAVESVNKYGGVMTKDEMELVVKNLK